MSLEDLEREMRGLRSKPAAPSAAAPKAVAAAPAKAPAEAPKPAARPQNKATAATSVGLLPAGPMTPERADELAQLIASKIKEMKALEAEIAAANPAGSKTSWDELQSRWKRHCIDIVRGLNQHQAWSANAPGTIRVSRSTVESEMKRAHVACKACFDKAEATRGVDRYRAIFDRLDKDHSGAIDTDELAGAMKGLGITLTARNKLLIMARVDRDRNGAIDFQEFTQLMSLVMSARGMFLQADKDQSGEIEQEELQDLFTSLGFFNYSGMLLQGFREVFDYDKSGTIGFEEFFNFVLFYKELNDAFEQKKKNWAQFIFGDLATAKEVSNFEDCIDWSNLSFAGFFSTVFQRWLDWNKRAQGRR
jgi:Ca2+-binding EF-hand superfamily protein